MNRLTLAAALLALVPSAQPVVAETLTSSVTLPTTPTLTIRLYTISSDDTPPPATLAQTSSLLADAGLGSRWTSCGLHRADSSCASPLSPTELAMRFIRNGAAVPHSGLMSMGTSLVDTARHTGILATLYLDRIESLAHITGTSVDVLLARAMAHEAAHLVLGTNEHGDTGLMRPLWSRDMLLRDPVEEWTFTRDEGERMRKALASR